MTMYGRPLRNVVGATTRKGDMVVDYSVIKERSETQEAETAFIISTEVKAQGHRMIEIALHTRRTRHGDERDLWGAASLKVPQRAEELSIYELGHALMAYGFTHEEIKTGFEWAGWGDFWIQ